MTHRMIIARHGRQLSRAGIRVVIGTILGALAVVAVARSQEISRPDNAELVRATELYEQGWWDDAAQILEDLVVNKPTDPEVYASLAMVYVAKTDRGQRVDRGKMEKYAKRAIELDGSNSKYHMILGHSVGLRALKGSKLKILGRAKASKRAYEKAVELDPKNMEAHRSLVEYLLQAPGIAGGSKKDALKQADVIAGIDPAEGHAVRANIYARLDEYDKAVDEARKAVELEPDSLQWRYGYAWLCRTLERFEEAESVYRTILDLDPDELDAYMNMGRMYRERNQWEKAEAQYEKILEIEPEHVGAYMDLGFMYQDGGVKRWDDAVAAFEKVLEIDPTRADALYQIGKTFLFAERNLDRAEECFREYLDSRLKGWWPDRASAHWRLAMVYELRGDTDLALTELQVAREVNPDNQEAKKMLRQLKRKKKMGR